jgi:hypothetical protein
VNSVALVRDVQRDRIARAAELRFEAHDALRARIAVTNTTDDLLLDYLMAATHRYIEDRYSAALALEHAAVSELDE